MYKLAASFRSRLANRGSCNKSSSHIRLCFTVFFLSKLATSASEKEIYREFKGFQIAMNKMSEETSRFLSGHGNEQIFLDLKVKTKPSSYTLYHFSGFLLCLWTTHMQEKTEVFIQIVNLFQSTSLFQLKKPIISSNSKFPSWKHM